MQNSVPSPHDYQLFKKWFVQNGGLFHKIGFPTKFPPLDYVGVSAQKNIRANQVFLAIPKKLIISVTKVRDSALGPTLQKYQCLNNNQNQQTQFNILTLYLIWQRMLEVNSFFYPYLQAVDKAETIIQWPDEDILKMNDPYITIEAVNQLRQQFPPIYKQFHQLSIKNPQLFPSPISWQLFMQCYSFVMTRCFGWGLPQTMLVPFADFLNHNCHGVNHYTFNKKLQQYTQNSQYSKQYVKKRKQIDLQLLGVNNYKQLPISYQRNQRQKFIDEHHIKYNSQDRLFSSQTRQYLERIHKVLLLDSYNTPLYPSSNSQDNDSEEQALQPQQSKQKIYSKQICRLARQQLQHRFQQPKPFANSQFEDQTTFNWWGQLEEADSYFIMAAHRPIKTGEQIFNSYGRRSNRFLLVWYGFTHFNNKYDSVAFRFWDQNMEKLTGKSIFVRGIGKQNWVKDLNGEKVSIENCDITDQYRLKKDNLCFELMAYLRLRIVRKNPVFRGLYIKKLLTIHKIHNLQLQYQMLDAYRAVLIQLEREYSKNQPRPQLSTVYHDYFANLLISSNNQIIENHIKGIKILKQVIQRLENGEKLQQIYKIQIGQQKLLVQNKNQTQDMKKQKKLQNRKLVIGYFRLLDKFYNKK